MKSLIKTFILIIAAGFIFSCTKDNIIIPDEGETSGIEYITISLDDDEMTKTSYAMEEGLLKTSWSEGDIVSVVPDLGLLYAAGTYQVTDPGSSSGVFKQVTAVSKTAEKYGYAIIYPGNKIKSLPQFTKFSYEGQVQKKSDPMAHLGAFHTMWKKVTDYSTISLSGADQSSCMKFTLKGMTFHNPIKIEVQVKSANRFYENNYVNESYSYYTSDSPKDLTSVSSLSLDLEGYGDETCIEAWMMMSNKAVTLYAGDDLLVYVYQEDGKRYVAHIPITQKTTLNGGKWHNLKIKNGWEQGTGDFAKYDWDGEVVQLQDGYEGLDLVIMGDGFIKEDFDNGTYDRIMRQAYEEFFNIEPFSTLRNGFNVAYVKAPSPERVLAKNTGANGATNTGTKTKFKTQFKANSTTLTGDNDLVREYAKKAFKTNANNRILDATIVVIVNQECRAGTCHNSWYTYNGKDYGQANAVAYCALGHDAEERIQIMVHEICGHGFGKLDDEYYYSGSISSTQPWIDQDSRHKLGLYRNVDKYVNQNFYSQLNGKYELTTKDNVYWHDLFNTANNYESSQVESLGVFEGAGGNYQYGFCRPTQDANKSIMNANTGIFNAISRRQIYYRYLRLSGQVQSNIYGTEEELNRFLDWDAAYILPKIVRQGVSNGLKNDMEESDITEGYSPLAPPVLHEGVWVDGRFIPNE